MCRGKRSGSHQRREGVPSPEGDHEAEPCEEKDAPIDIDGVKERDRSRLSVDRVDLRSRVQVGEFETHDDGLAVCGQKRSMDYMGRVFAQSGW